MLQIEDTIVSFDILEKKFVCDLEKCKGACCVMGDSGAPLEESELEIIEKIYPSVQSYLSTEGKQAIEANGAYTIDADGDYVTPLVNNKECAYVFFENAVAKCAIEKAFFDGAVDFRKPLSCHLYPARVKKYSTFSGVNYDKNNLCNPAEKLGNKTKVPLYVFLEDSFTRKFGGKWYEQLKYAAENKDKIISK